MMRTGRTPVIMPHGGVMPVARQSIPYSSRHRAYFRILALRAQGGLPLQLSVEAQQGQIGALVALRQHKITLLREIFPTSPHRGKQPCGMLSFIARCGAA